MFRLQRITFLLLLLPHQEVYPNTCWYIRSPHTAVCWQTESAQLSPVLHNLFECIYCVCVTEWEDNPSAGWRSQFPESHFDRGSHWRQHRGGCRPQVCYCHRIRYVCVTVLRLAVSEAYILNWGPALLMWICLYMFTWIVVVIMIDWWYDYDYHWKVSCTFIAQ